MVFAVVAAMIMEDVLVFVGVRRRLHLSRDEVDILCIENAPLQGRLFAQVGDV